MRNLTVLILAVATAQLGCTKVVKNTAAKTPPSVVIKIRGADGQYATASTASLAATAASQLDVMCIVRDDEGVKSAALSFSSGTSHCTLPGGAVYSGSFSISSVPASQVQGLTPDGSGKVLEQLPLMASLHGPFTCDVLGNGQGTPYGADIVATCTGVNWAADATKAKAEAKLTVSLH